MTHGSRRALRLLLTLLLAAYGISCLRHPTEFRIVDNVNLPIHETGHLVFAPFGDFVQALGGTLFELIVPAVFLGYFLTKRDRHAASVALWWIAENLWYIAVYIADARRQELPLVGGGEHDWTYILSEMGLMHRDVAIGHTVHMWGVALFVVATVWGILEAVFMKNADDALPADALTVQRA
jgi:hypothetical protein